MMGSHSDYEDKSQVTFEVEWSKENPGTIHMRTGDSRTEAAYSGEDYMWVSAHEFIHILGVDDSYNTPYAKENPDFISITNKFGTPVQSDDIAKVLEAYNTNTWQMWP